MFYIHKCILIKQSIINRPATEIAETRDSRIFRRNKMDFNRGGGGFRRDFGPREMHKATCSECGNDCEVPFKPTEGKPVYCKDCYKKRKGF